MSDLKIPGGLAVGVGVTVGPAGPQANPKVDAPAAPVLPADGFKGVVQQGAGAAAQLTGLALGLPLPAADLAAAAKHLTDPAAAQGAFQSAYAVIQDQLLDHPGLNKDDLGQRANEFFTEYAQAFVQTATEPPPPSPPTPEQAAQPQPPPPPPERPVTPEQQKALAREFADSLKALGFQALKNVANGKDGVENAFHLLTADGKKEFAALAKDQKIKVEGQFPPKFEAETDIPDAGPPRAAPEAAAPPKMEGPGRLESEATANAAEAPPPQEELQAPPLSGARVQEDEDGEEGGPKRRKKGQNVLWSVLQTFRRRDEAVRQAEEKWDRVAVAALLFLLFVALVVVALVSL